MHIQNCFDANRIYKIRPLKDWIMPMQDGKFKDESGEHPLGKCIFVFAGGTSESFEQFTRPMSSKNAEEQKTFRDLKAPDFVSRLRGTINVLGPRLNGTSYPKKKREKTEGYCEKYYSSAGEFGVAGL